MTSCFVHRATSDDGSNLAEETGIRMLVHYDHEEVGSDSAQGAGLSMTEDAMRRVCRALGGDDVEGAAERSRRKSFIVSLSFYIFVCNPHGRLC